MRAALRFCLLILLAGCSIGPVSSAAWHSGEPVTEEEKLVATYLEAPEANSPEGARITFTWLEWGPHDLTGQTHWHKDVRGNRVVRVRYQSRGAASPPVIHDHLFTVDANGEVRNRGAMTNNPSGRNWLAEDMEAKRKQERAGTP